MTSDIGSAKDVWIYHEKQEAMLCGQHALNNLVQAASFTPNALAELAQQLDTIELSYMANNNEGGTQSKDYIRRIAEGSGNVDEQGNFSIEVLRAALLNQYGLSLPNIKQENILTDMDVTEVDGFVCNRQSHWFAIRKLNGRYWNLNSTLDRPELISHFQLATEIESYQNDGYSVFCVKSGLPEPCQAESGLERGLAKFWWKETDLILKKTNAMTADADPWNNVGSGMRLDGKSTKSFENTSEDDMLSMAIEASMQDINKKAHGGKNDSDTVLKKVELTAEPDATHPDAVRIQFRMPTGITRRFFLITEPVAMIYSFLEEKLQGETFQNNLELRCGFPPVDISSKRNQTIGEAKLAGENIIVRFK